MRRRKVSTIMMMRPRMTMRYENVDGMPSPPWAVRTRCSLLFPANKHLYVMVHQKIGTQLKFDFVFHWTLQRFCAFLFV